jgi:hypothetical protein
VLGEIDAAAGSAIVIEIFAVAVPEIAPVAVTVITEVAAETVGVPEITPVEALRSNPVGKVPLVIEYVIAPENPVAERTEVAEIALSFTPLRF